MVSGQCVYESESERVCWGVWWVVCEWRKMHWGGDRRRMRCTQRERGEIVCVWMWERERERETLTHLDNGCGVGGCGVCGVCGVVLRACSPVT